jgi:adenosylmethionine-8-amino-7-oxononanoate aminotransferase
MSKIDKNFIWHPYNKINSELKNYHCTSANGVYITLDGKKVIDGMSSWWAVIHGYNNPILNDAIKSQVDDFSHIMFGGITHDPAIKLTEKLLEILPKPLNKVFYSDSGSVAVEVAMKMALQYQHKIGKNKTKFIAINGGYHGDTFATMSVCSPDGMHSAFAKNIMQNIFAKQPTLQNSEIALQDLREKLQQNNDIAAMILEPIVQNAGGMNFYSPLYLKGVSDLCDEFEILLIADEIATGFGRTGELFACDYAEITPDILCIGKALTGGYLSLGATITTQKIADRIGVLMHGPTFMANPLATSVAAASIDLLLKDDWQENIKRIEKVLTEQLLQLVEFESVADTRVLGAIGVIEFKDDLDIKITQEILIKNGVWLRPFGKLLYTMPPFITTDDELFTITNAIKKIVLYKT